MNQPIKLVPAVDHLGETAQQDSPPRVAHWRTSAVVCNRVNSYLNACITV